MFKDHAGAGVDRPGLEPLVVAPMVGVSEETLRVWRSRRRGPAFYKLGRRILYHPRDVQTFIDSRRIETMGAVRPT